MTTPQSLPSKSSTNKSSDAKNNPKKLSVQLNNSDSDNEEEGSSYAARRSKRSRLVDLNKSISVLHPGDDYESRIQIMPSELLEFQYFINRDDCDEDEESTCENAITTPKVSVTSNKYTFNDKSKSSFKLKNKSNEKSNKPMRNSDKDRSDSNWMTNRPSLSMANEINPSSQYVDYDADSSDEEFMNQLIINNNKLNKKKHDNNSHKKSDKNAAKDSNDILPSSISSSLLLTLPCFERMIAVLERELEVSKIFLQRQQLCEGHENKINDMVMGSTECLHSMGLFLQKCDLLTKKMVENDTSSNKRHIILNKNEEKSFLKQKKRVETELDNAVKDIVGASGHAYGAVGYRSSVSKGATERYDSKEEAVHAPFAVPVLMPNDGGIVRNVSSTSSASIPVRIPYTIAQLRDMVPLQRALIVMSKIIVEYEPEKTYISGKQEEVQLHNNNRDSRSYKGSKAKPLPPASSLSFSNSSSSTSFKKGLKQNAATVNTDKPSNSSSLHKDKLKQLVQTSPSSPPSDMLLIEKERLIHDVNIKRESSIALSHHVTLEAIYNYWLQKRSKYLESFLRCYHHILTDRWDRVISIPPLPEDHNIEKLKLYKSILIHLQYDLDRSRLIVDRVRKREKIKKEIHRISSSYCDELLATCDEVEESELQRLIAKSTFSVLCDSDSIGNEICDEKGSDKMSLGLKKTKESKSSNDSEVVVVEVKRSHKKKVKLEELPMQSKDVNANLLKNSSSSSFSSSQSVNNKNNNNDNNDKNDNFSGSSKAGNNNSKVGNNIKNGKNSEESSQNICVNVLAVKSVPVSNLRGGTHARNGTVKKGVKDQETSIMANGTEKNTKGKEDLVQRASTGYSSGSSNIKDRSRDTDAESNRYAKKRKLTVMHSGGESGSGSDSSYSEDRSTTRDRDKSHKDTNSSNHRAMTTAREDRSKVRSNAVMPLQAHLTSQTKYANDNFAKKSVTYEVNPKVSKSVQSYTGARRVEYDVATDKSSKYMLKSENMKRKPVIGGKKTSVSVSSSPESSSSSHSSSTSPLSRKHHLKEVPHELSSSKKKTAPPPLCSLSLGMLPFRTRTALKSGAGGRSVVADTHHNSNSSIKSRSYPFPSTTAGRYYYGNGKQ